MPRWTHKLHLRLRSLFHKSRVERELSEELLFHLERMMEERVANGKAPDEAGYAALRELGGMEQIKEQCRDMRRVNYIENLIQDIRYGIRMLAKNPGFTVIAVLTLALGIGANTAIFSVVYGVIFRPLPYRDPDRLVTLWTNWLEKPGSRSAVSLPDFRDWESQNSVFEGLAAYGYNRYDIPDLEDGGSVRAAMVTADFFPLLGVKPLLGREIVAADERERVGVLSYALWQRLYHGDRNAIGRSLRLRERPITIIGVMPPSFRLPSQDVEMWLSLADIFTSSGVAGVGNWLTDRGLRGYRVLARLKQGVSLAQAQNQMDAIERRLAASYPKEDKGFGVVAVVLRTQLLGEVQPAMLLLMGAVTFILLIACVNVANLMLARATLRERETAIRYALGAGVGRLAGQILTESVLLGAIGGGLGLFIAYWGVDLSLRLSPRSIPRLQDVRLDMPVLLFALAATIGSSLLFGLATVFRALGSHFNDALRGVRRVGGDDNRGRRLRSSLVTGEIALATVLVTGAALMLNSFLRLATLNPGFQPDSLLTFDVVASLSRYREPQQQNEFFNRVLERVRALPGVKKAGACTSLPPDIAQESDTFQIQGLTPVEPEKSPEAWYLPATTGYFEALGLPLIRGREFTNSDTHDGPAVAIINQEVVRRYFGQSDPLGREIDFRGVKRSIVGVVGDTSYDGLGTPPEFQIYIPYAQGTFPGLHFVIRTTSEPMSQVAAVHTAVNSVDSEARPARISTMEQLLSGSIRQPRFYAWLLAAFGSLALALAVVGTYGVMSYSVSHRTHEIGIRMTLGAKRGEVLKLVIVEGFVITGCGVLLGIAGGLALTRFLSSLLYGITPTDPLTFIGVSVLLTMVALLASYIPAHRATKVDPMVALRHE